MPRSCSMLIQSEVAWGPFLPLTLPATWIALPSSSSFSVIVVLPASGCEIMAKVRREAICLARSGMNLPGKKARIIRPFPAARSPPHTATPARREPATSCHCTGCGSPRIMRT